MSRLCRENTNKTQVRHVPITDHHHFHRHHHHHHHHYVVVMTLSVMWSETVGLSDKTGLRPKNRSWVTGTRKHYTCRAVRSSQGWRPRSDSLIFEHQTDLEKLTRVELVTAVLWSFSSSALIIANRRFYHSSLLSSNVDFKNRSDKFWKKSGYDV